MSHLVAPAGLHPDVERYALTVLASREDSTGHIGNKTWIDYLDFLVRLSNERMKVQKIATKDGTEYSDEYQTFLRFVFANCPIIGDDEIGMATWNFFNTLGNVQQRKSIDAYYYAVDYWRDFISDAVRAATNSAANVMSIIESLFAFSAARNIDKNDISSMVHHGILPGLLDIVQAGDSFTPTNRTFLFMWLDVVKTEMMNYDLPTFRRPLFLRAVFDPDGPMEKIRHVESSDIPFVSALPRNQIGWEIAAIILRHPVYKAWFNALPVNQIMQTILEQGTELTEDDMVNLRVLASVGPVRSPGKRISAPEKTCNDWAWLVNDKVTDPEQRAFWRRLVGLHLVPIEKK